MAAMLSGHGEATRVRHIGHLQHNQDRRKDRQGRRKDKQDQRVE